jgi:hypothetical protein
VSPLLSPDEKLVSHVEDLLGVPPDVFECVEPISPELEVPVAAVENGLQVGRHQVAAGVILAPGIPAHEDQVEVLTVSCRVCLPCTTGDHQPPKPRSRRQPHQGVGEEAVKRGKADEQALVQAPALTRSFAERRARNAGPAQDLDVLVRNARSPRWLGHGFERNALSQTLELAH